MDLIERVSADIKDAMRARDQIKLNALRGVKKELIEAKTAKSLDAVLSEEEGMKILQKMAKQRKDTAEVYREQNRPDLMEQEIAEFNVISIYLPAQFTEEELIVAVKEIIARTGVTSAKEIGKVMGIASKELAGKADGRDVSRVAKELLG